MVICPVNPNAYSGCAAPAGPHLPVLAVHAGGDGPLSFTSIMEAGDDSPAHSPAAAAFTANRVKRIAAARLAHDAVTGFSCDLTFLYHQDPGTDNYYHLKRQCMDCAGVYDDVHTMSPARCCAPRLRCFSSPMPSCPHTATPAG